MMLNLPEFPQGSDITLMNTIYHKPRKDEDGKKIPDALTMIIKDNTTGNKIAKTIHQPQYTYYKIKDEYVTDYNQIAVPKEQVEEITVPYNTLVSDIAERTGNKDFYYENIRNGNYRANRYLHTNTSILNSDMDINDRVRVEFFRMYGMNEEVSLTKSYLDIEADTIDMAGDFPELGECPVNAVTVIDGTSENVYTFALRNPKNPLIAQFEYEYMQDMNKFKQEMKDLIRDTVGGWKNEVRFGLDKLNFELLFFDDEIEMLVALFHLINATKPDFVLAWNMAFDIPYIIERLKILGVDPVSVLCHPDFEIKECYYYIDTRNDSDLAERGDYAKISSYSVYLDQMIHFASRRKGQSAFKRFNLDTIGQTVAKVKKLDYSHITKNIAELPWKDYKIFIMYNIVDTIVQKCIEVKTDDIGYVFGKASINCIRYEKCHRNTLYLKNRGTIEFYQDNDMIIGNNVNLDVQSSQYAGAIVGDPLLVKPVGIQVNGVPIRMYRNGVDYDYKSLYPSLMIELNLAPNTQVGKMIIDTCVYEFENEFHNPDWNRGAAFAQDIISRNYITIGHRWFGLATYKDIIKDIMEYHIIKAPRRPMTLTQDGALIPFYFNPEIIPFEFKEGPITPFLIESSRPNINKGIV